LIIDSTTDGVGHIGVIREQLKQRQDQLDAQESLSNLAGSKAIGDVATLGGGLTPEATVRLRHYTNSQGVEGIEASNVIEFGDQGSVFFERAGGKPLSPRDAEAKYGLKKGNGRHIVETDVPLSRVNREWNPSRKTQELRVSGNVPLVNPRIIRRR
jgi:hypothetical protein